jgi:hypothetical protein
MIDSDSAAKKRKPNSPDVIKEYTDGKGRKVIVSAEFKIFNDRMDIATITVHAKDSRSPITRRMLSEIPLDVLFRDDLAIESEHLNRILRNRKVTTAHQGRQHSDEDLLAVAEIYNAAFLARRPVQRAVADAFGVSLSTAGKRIMAARRRGFMPSTHGES